MTSFSDLPCEVIEIILKNLTLEERFGVSTVSKAIFSAVQNLSNPRLNLEFCRVDDATEPTNIFHEPIRTYKRLTFGDSCQFTGAIEQFCSAICPNLIELTFDKTFNLPADALNVILNHCTKKLKKLAFTLAPDQFFPDGVAVTFDGTNVRHFSLHGFTITRGQFESMAKAFPNLDSLHVTFCTHWWSHCGKLIPSEQLLTYSYLIDFLEDSPKPISDVVLCNQSTQNSEEHQHINYHLNFFTRLKQKNIKKFCFPMTQSIDTYESFLETNREIVSIGHEFLMHLNIFNVSLFSKNLRNLESLEFSCMQFTGRLDFVYEFPKLKTFRVKAIDQYVSFTIQQFVPLMEAGPNHRRDHNRHPQLNYNLENFSLHDCGRICHDCFKTFTESYPNVQTLEMQNTHVNDEDVKMILLNMKNLRELNLSKNMGITDDAFIGVTHLSDLVRLEKVNFAGTRITQVALMSAFKLPHLKELNLSKLRNIPNAVFGIEAIVRNCPLIEHLILTKCSGINDDCIRKIVEHLSKLKRLNVNDCSHLRNDMLVHLYNFTGKLQFLHCNSAYLESFSPKEVFTRIPSLKLLEYQNVYHRYNEEYKYDFYIRVRNKREIKHPMEFL